MVGTFLLQGTLQQQRIAAHGVFLEGFGSALQFITKFATYDFHFYKHCLRSAKRRSAL